MATGLKKIAVWCVVVVALVGLLFANMAQAQDLCAGFEPPSECPAPINCFRPDPVCGANGVTYTCGCPEAACAGVRVVKFGKC